MKRKTPKVESTTPDFGDTDETSKVDSRTGSVKLFIFHSFIHEEVVQQVIITYIHHSGAKYVNIYLVGRPYIDKFIFQYCIVDYVSLLFIYPFMSKCVNSF